MFPGEREVTMSEHRTSFTAAEWLTLRTLAEHLDGAKNPDDQQSLRSGMRGLGFYIMDFDAVGDRFGLVDLQRLLDGGRLTIRG
jgi:hypothetical protein